MSDDKPETEAEEPYFSTNMDEAPKDGTPVLLLVPTGDSEDPLAVEMGYWDATENRWTGEWRHEVTKEGSDTPTEYAKTDPVGWGDVPEIEPAVYRALGMTPPADEEEAEAA
jgi:hypothetical protein